MRYCNVSVLRRRPDDRLLAKAPDSRDGRLAEGGGARRAGDGRRQRRWGSTRNIGVFAVDAAGRPLGLVQLYDFRRSRVL